MYVLTDVLFGGKRVTEKEGKREDEDAGEICPEEESHTKRRLITDNMKRKRKGVNHKQTH
jgi:hypothetical protein